MFSGIFGKRMAAGEWFKGKRAPGFREFRQCFGVFWHAKGSPLFRIIRRKMPDSKIGVECLAFAHSILSLLFILSKEQPTK